MHCYKCRYFKGFKNQFSTSLINITETLLDFKDLNNIIFYKFQNQLYKYNECSQTNIKNNRDKYKNIIDIKNGKSIQTLNLDSNNIILPKFILFIPDIDFNILKNEDIQNKLSNIFKDKIILKEFTYILWILFISYIYLIHKIFYILFPWI